MTTFITTVKRIFKQPLNWLFIFLFPMICFLLIGMSTSDSDNQVDGSMTTSLYVSFGVLDQDGSTLSQTLVNRLGMRYNLIEVSEDDITGALTNQEIPWALVIREGYEADVLAGREPKLDGYSLTVSDMSALGSVTAQNITRALIVLGAGDEQTLSDWEEASFVDTEIIQTGDNWSMISFWLGFFGFISMFTAFFITRTLMDDKRGGMPDRVGVLPQTPRRHLGEGVLASFCASEITVILLLAAIRILLGEIPNAPYLFGLLSLYNLFTVGVVMAIFSLAKSSAVSSMAMTMLATIISMLGGLFWPLEFVPEFMRKLAWFSPGYWLSRGLENIKGISFEGYGMPMLFLAGFTLIALLLGGWKSVQAMED